MKVITMFCTSIFFCVIYIARAEYYGDDISELINRQVQDHVRHINENVNRQVANINNNVELQMKELHKNLHRMQMELATIGPRVALEVQKSLEPLEALKIQSKMAKGIGGITVATYGDKHTVFYKDGIKFICPKDSPDDDQPQSPNCTKQLSTTLTVTQKLCTSSSYSQVNNIYCFGLNSAIQCVYDSCQCLGGTLYTLSKLKSICGNSFGTDKYAKFTYFPTKTARNHIPIPNSNKHVTCDEGNSNIQCTWYNYGYIIDY